MNCSSYASNMFSASDLLRDLTHLHSAEVEGNVRLRVFIATDGG